MVYETCASWNYILEIHLGTSHLYPCMSSHSKDRYGSVDGADENMQSHMGLTWDLFSGNTKPVLYQSDSWDLASVCEHGTTEITKKFRRNGELNPGLPRDRREY